MEEDELEKDYERQKDDRRIVEKFESIEPQPQYCIGRYAYIENSSKIV